MKKYIISLLLILTIVSSGFAQKLDTRTKNMVTAKYFSAQNAYQNADYQKALEKLTEIDALLKNTSMPVIPTSLNLKVKTLIALKRFDEANKALNTLEGLQLSNDILQHISSYHDEINKGLEALRQQELAKEQARKAAQLRAERYKKARSEFLKVYENGTKEGFIYYIAMYPDSKYVNAAREILKCFDVKKLTIKGPDELRAFFNKVRFYKNLTYLDLRNNYLTSVPESIGSLKSLTVLYLANNQLTSIPESIGNLKNLKKLFLFNNQLTSLPASIWNLKNLTALSLANNQLTFIPESIGNLKNLTFLSLVNNQLTSLPASIWNLENLSQLTLDHNPLASIPESIGKLKNLTELSISGDPITSLPKSIGSLQKLNEIDMDSTYLASLPESIGNLKNIYLDLSYDYRLTTLPKSLHHLQGWDIDLKGHQTKLMRLLKRRRIRYSIRAY